MKIVVLGGNGLVESKLVNRLRQLGQDVFSVAPNSGVSTATEEALRNALSGAQVVVDVTNTPSFEDKAAPGFFEASRRDLLAAEAASGVGHHVALSVVGADRLVASGHRRGNILEESLVATSGIPYTIARSTQCFESLERIAALATDGPIIRLPPVLIQPIAADDIAAAVADVALGPPLNGSMEIAGPEQIRLSDVVKRYLDALPDGRVVVSDDCSRNFDAELDDRSLVGDHNARIGAMRFREWLSRKLAAEADLTYP